MTSNQFSVGLNLKYGVGFVVAATESNSGKTVITLSLVASLIKRGYTVQTFKTGPDFIDPTHLTMISGRPCINLDLFMMGRDGCRTTFLEYSSDCDISIVEGVMGLFDGLNKQSSTADLAKLLSLPVLLVINASGLGESIIPKILGFLSFDNDLAIKWIIFNKISSKRHESLVRTCERFLPDSVKILGYIPKTGSLTLPSRHLGLYMGNEISYDQKLIEELTRVIDNYVNIECLLSETKEITPPTIKDRHESLAPMITHYHGKKVKALVARDDAFCFYYHDNLRILNALGVSIEFFSPLKDKSIPFDIDLILFGGGYPELFSNILCTNRELISLLRELILEKRVYVYAECGGLIYLSKYLMVDNECYEMLGILPLTIELSRERKVLAYREVELLHDCPLGKRGTRARGHEFHYSHIFKRDLEPNLYLIRDEDKGEIKEGFFLENVIASYIHIHFLSNRSIAENLVKACVNRLT